jgi:heavy metal sensor kinase
MFLKNDASFLHTATFRLTIWYLGLFSTLSLAVFGAVYVLLSTHLHDQTDSELMNTAVEFSTLYQQQGIEALRAEFRRESASQGTERVFFELISASGETLATSGSEEWKIPDVSNADRGINRSEPVFHTVALPEHRHKARIIIMPAGSGSLLRIGSTLAGDDLLLERYRETFGTALLIMIICGGVVGWLLARKAMSGVKKVTETALRIGKQDFSQRVTVTDEGLEINLLVQSFNDMLERIELLLNELQQMTDNVAHELRTPITRIRGIAETTLKANGKIDEYREMAASVIDGSDELVEMINVMLEISRTDAGVTKFTTEPVNVVKLIEDAVDLFEPVADDRRIKLSITTSAQNITVQADPQKLQRVISNLLDNAIKYTAPRGSVSLGVGIRDNLAKIEISDSGSGIDAKEIGRIFDRFYRCDKSRTAPGSGLGLSLAQAIIRAHGGDITVTSSSSGSVFCVLLPLAP